MEILEQRVTFPSAGRPPLQLEGVLTCLRDAERAPAVLLCHPQPATSSMEDPLLRQLAHALASEGMLALRFNFRGVGASEGQQTDGRLEPLDIAGAVAYALSRPEVRPERLALVGHAFGAAMALAYAAHDPRVSLLVAVSLPIYRITEELALFDRPRLFVTGEYDEVSPRHKLEPWIAQLPPPCALSVITGARHLMRDHEAVASTTIATYLRRWAQVPVAWGSAVAPE